MFVVTSHQCAECGSDVTVRLFTRKPTDDEVSEVAGSSRCAKTVVVEVEPDGPAVDA